MVVLAFVVAVLSLITGQRGLSDDSSVFSETDSKPGRTVEKTV